MNKSSEGQWIRAGLGLAFLLMGAVSFVSYQNATQLMESSQQVRETVDEKLLYSILSNLLSNAIKYSPPESTIYFTFSGKPETVKFEIQDEGIGMSIEDQQKLYDPFSRGSNARTILGTGLGLAIVKKCLDLHQGQIFVESQVGNGSTFTVQIPQSHPKLLEQTFK